MINTVLNLLFPVDCVLCAEPVKDWRSGALCEACEGRLLPQNSPRCAQCGLPAPAIEGLCRACTTGKTQFDFGRSALVFDDNLRQVIHHFKYNDRVSSV